MSGQANANSQADEHLQFHLRTKLFKAACLAETTHGPPSNATC